MDPAPRPSPSRSPLDRALVTVLLVAAAAYAIFLYRAGAAFAGGADSSGYFNLARQLGHGEFYAPVRALPGFAHTHFSQGAFMPLGFVVDPARPRMAPTYPAGLPLHLLAAAQIVGWDRAALVVNVAGALAAGWLLWLLGRHFGLPPAWSAAGVAWLWLCPLYVQYALQPMSDALALTWSLATLYAALRARAGPGLGWSAAAGAALAMAVLTRPSNALLLLPVVWAIGFRPRALVALALGGLPGAVFFGYENYHVYGSILTTGYGDVGALFKASYLPHNLGHVALWLPALLSPLIAAALAWPLLPGRWTRDTQVLVLWVMVLTAFYLFYFHTGETWWYLRFILPVVPVWILGALVTLHAGLARRGAWALAVILIFFSAWEVGGNRFLASANVATGENFYREAADWARDHLPPDSAIFCMQVSGAFYFYTDFLVVRWEQIEPASIEPLLAALRAQHRPVYAALYDFEAQDAFARLGGHWKKIGTAGATTIWQRED